MASLASSVTTKGKGRARPSSVPRSLSSPSSAIKRRRRPSPDTHASTSVSAMIDLTRDSEDEEETTKGTTCPPRGSFAQQKQKSKASYHATDVPAGAPRPNGTKDKGKSRALPSPAPPPSVLEPFCDTTNEREVDGTVGARWDEASDAWLGNSSAGQTMANMMVQAVRAREVDALLTDAIAKAAQATCFDADADECNNKRAEVAQLKEYWKGTVLDVDQFDLAKVRGAEKYTSGFLPLVCAAIIELIKINCSLTYQDTVDVRVVRALRQPMNDLVHLLSLQWILSPEAQKYHLACHRETGPVDPARFLQKLNQNDLNGYLYLMGDTMSTYIGKTTCFKIRIVSYQQEFQAYADGEHARPLIRHYFSADRLLHTEPVWYKVAPLSPVIGSCPILTRLYEGLAATLTGSFGPGGIKAPQYFAEMGREVEETFGGVVGLNRQHPVLGYGVDGQNYLESFISTWSELLSPEGANMHLGRRGPNRTFKKDRFYCRLPCAPFHLQPSDRDAEFAIDHTAFEKGNCQYTGLINVRLASLDPPRLEVRDIATGTDLSEYLKGGAAKALRYALYGLAVHRQALKQIDLGGRTVEGFAHKTPFDKLHANIQAARLLNESLSFVDNDGHEIHVNSATVRRATDIHEGGKKQQVAEVNINHAGLYNLPSRTKAAAEKTGEEYLTGIFRFTIAREKWDKKVKDGEIDIGASADELNEYERKIKSGVEFTYTVHGGVSVNENVSTLYIGGAAIPLDAGFLPKTRIKHTSFGPQSRGTAPTLQRIETWRAEWMKRAQEYGAGEE